MLRNLDFFLRFCILAFCCFNFSVVFAQTDDRVDLTGDYAGALKFPSANLNGKATLKIEGNKFRLLTANGVEKSGRITAIKTGGDYDSIALMFDETPTENQPFTHSMMSLRLRKTGKTLVFTNAPGDEREFRFEAVAENSSNKLPEKSAGADFSSQTKDDCADPKSSKCGISFGFVPADKLENNAAPKTKQLPEKANSNFSLTTLKLETDAENKQSRQPMENRKAVETSHTESASFNGKQPSIITKETPKTIEAKTQDEASLTVFKQATDEMRRATVEIRRATDEIKATTDELHRFRTESAAKTTTASKAKTGKTRSKKISSAVSFKSPAARPNKTVRKSAVSTKSMAKKPSPAKTTSSKTAAVKPAAKKSAAKSTDSKSVTKKEPEKPVAPSEKANPTKAAETTPSPSPTPKPSPASSPTPNANNSNVGKGAQ